MITIYHNNRCSKSRCGLSYLQENGVEFSIRHYLDEPLNFDELKSLIAKTGMKPEEIVRKEEDYFKQHLKGKTLTDDEWIKEMINEPKLIQRPIVANENKAVLARPAELIDKIL
jgi:arsenate reductase